MKTYLLQTICLAMIFSCLLNISLQAEWKGGVAKANITPPNWMPMAGYASRKAKHPDSKLTDLWAKAIVIEDENGHQAVLVTLDLIGIDRPLSQKICQQISENHDLSRSQISLATSHTHTGPVVASNLRPMHYLLFDEANQKLVDDYAIFLADAVVSAVDRAFKDVSPATFSWGSGKATFAVNRRNNPEKDVPQLRNEGKLKGPSDHDVPVLVIKKKEQIKGIVFGYACHSTTISSFKWSGDYGGFAQINLEKQYPGAIALFWAGCGGDQNPLPRRTVELAKEYGQRLAKAVSDVIEKPMKELDGQLSTKYEEVDLALAALPSKTDLEEQAKSANVYIASRAKFHLERLAEGIELSQSYPYPVQAWKLGNDLNWVFLGGEVVIDFAIRIKEEHGAAKFNNTNIWVAGYANDVMAYIPSRRVLLEGGYEGGGAMIYYGLPTIWAPEVEETIIDSVNRLNEK
jgi:neutral ceramidase